MGVIGVLSWAPAVRPYMINPGRESLPLQLLRRAVFVYSFPIR
jgi:hypothetical protein